MLGRLCASARKRARLLNRDAILAAIGDIEHAAPAPSLIAALGAGSEVAVVAELKRRSPSKGVLREELAPGERAGAYAKGGARALSVLTEPEEFGGSAQDLTAASQASRLPTLKKDFHVTPIQVWEARSLHASALLLIARALGPRLLDEMMAECRRAEIEALVEVRSEAELSWALDSGSALIGVNSRDLESLEVDPEVHAHLLPQIPAACVAVAESGVGSRLDVSRAALQGADAVLVGSFLSQSNDPVRATSALTGVARVSRAG
ncbi:MAG: indole-3-glycerol-phosphate synthase [Gemmatimonadaceae bacterium]